MPDITTITDTGVTRPSAQIYRRTVIKKVIGIRNSRALNLRVRISIAIDSHLSTQSRSLAEVWTADGWAQVHVIPGETLTDRPSAYTQDPAEAATTAYTDKLIAELLHIAIDVAS
jgi:hypothetical protein